MTIRKLLLGLMILSAVTLVTAQTKRAPYKPDKWIEKNHSKLKSVGEDVSGKPIKFEPTRVEGEFEPNRVKVISFYDIDIYYDLVQDVVVRVSDDSRAKYYIIFAYAAAVNMGAKPYELIIDVKPPTGMPYLVSYNVKSDEVTPIVSSNVTQASRFVSRLPRPIYVRGREGYNDKFCKLYHELFKLLAAGKYKEAWEQRNKLIVQANQADGMDGERLVMTNKYIYNAYPLWELAEALLYDFPASYVDRQELPYSRSPLKAYQYVTEVFRRDILLDEANVFLASSDIRMTVDMIKSRIENDLIAATRSEGTIDAYDRLLTILYNSDQRKPLRKEQEAIAYKRLVTSTVQDDYRAYLNKYRDVDEAHTEAAEQRLENLIFEQIGPTAADCRMFLKQYPTSKNASKVRKLMYERAYNEIKPTAASCEAWLKNYGDGDSIHYREVYLKMYDYAFDEIGDDEEKAASYMTKYPYSGRQDEVDRKLVEIRYNKARRADTAEAYEDFLKKHPFTKYSHDARERLAELDPEAAERTGATAAPTLGNNIRVNTDDTKPTYTGPKVISNSGGRKSSGKKSGSQSTSTKQTQSTSTKPAENIGGNINDIFKQAGKKK